MKKDAVVALFSVVIVGVAAWALAAVRPDRPLTPSKPFEGSSGQAKKKAATGKVVLHVNGEPITESEFNAFLQAAPAEARTFYASPQGRRLLADELVKLKVLEQEGRRLGVDDDPEVRSQLESIGAQIVAGKTLERLVSQDTDKRVTAAFEKEKGSATTLRHILIAYRGSQFPPKSGGEAPSADAAMQKAAGLVAQLRAGASFADLARRESDDPQTAERGGSIGAISADQLPPSMAATVRQLKLGQVSDPVRTEYGVQIFKLDAPSIEDVRPALTERVKREAAAEAIERLQKAAKVEYDESFFPPAPAQPQVPGSAPNPQG